MPAPAQKLFLDFGTTTNDARTHTQSNEIFTPTIGQPHAAQSTQGAALRLTGCSLFLSLSRGIGLHHACLIFAPKPTLKNLTCTFGFSCVAAGIRVGGDATEDIARPLRANVARFAALAPVWRATFGRPAGTTKALAEAEQRRAAIVATADLILPRGKGKQRVPY